MNRSYSRQYQKAVQKLGTLRPNQLWKGARAELMDTYGMTFADANITLQRWRDSGLLKHGPHGLTRTDIQLESQHLQPVERPAAGGKARYRIRYRKVANGREYTTDRSRRYLLGTVRRFHSKGYVLLGIDVSWQTPWIEDVGLTDQLRKG